MKRIIVEYEKCDGCKNCSAACMQAHRTTEGTIYDLDFASPENESRNFILKDGRGRYKPLFCRHCDDPECVKSCMSGALKKDPESGHVFYDETRCGSCFMCVMNCPFGVLKPDQVSRSKVIKCDFCVNAGGEPSCVSSCPKKAIHVEEVEAEGILPQAESSSSPEGRADYMIIGAGVAGIEAVKEIRKRDKKGSICMISADTQVHSRCMLHKYIAGERDEAGLDFTEEDFFDKYQVQWIRGLKVIQVCADTKEVFLENGEKAGYCKLLLANGADSFIPPVGELRKASNVYGLRNLSDAQAIVAEAEKAEHVLVIGSGLVGLDAAYGLLERGKEITIVEMADRILPVQLDAHGALGYQERFEKAGVRFVLGRKASQAVCEPDGKIHKVTLDNGEELSCDLVIVAAGVRPSVGYLDGSKIACDRGITVDERMRTSIQDIYAAGDITGRSGIWPNAADQGRIAGRSMCGLKAEYTDTYAMKNTINFFGLETLCVGRIQAGEGDEVLIKEDRNQYKRAIVKGGKVEGILLQGNIANAGFWQYLIKNAIDIRGIRENIFDISYADFYHVGKNGAYQWE